MGCSQSSNHTHIDKNTIHLSTIDKILNCLQLTKHSYRTYTFLPLTKRFKERTPVYSWQNSVSIQLTIHHTPVYNWQNTLIEHTIYNWQNILIEHTPLHTILKVKMNHCMLQITERQDYHYTDHSPFVCCN